MPLGTDCLAQPAVLGFGFGFGFGFGEFDDNGDAADTTAGTAAGEPCVQRSGGVQPSPRTPGAPGPRSVCAGALEEPQLVADQQADSQPGRVGMA